MSEDKEHSFNLDGWCTKCGQSLYDYLNDKYPECLATKNVEAISHVVREARFKDLEYERLRD